MWLRPVTTPIRVITTIYASKALAARIHGKHGRIPPKMKIMSFAQADFLRYSNRPARVHDEHSETPYITRRAMDFIREADDQPWCLHLSYIKPRWPDIVPSLFTEIYDVFFAPPVSAAIQR
jgi:hypothetical protein